MQDVGDSERAKLAKRFGKTFDAGAAIYSEGEPADLCFLIQQGRVRLVKHIRSAERSLTVLHAGDLFGEAALLHGARRTAAAVALTEVTALALDRETFGQMVAGNPAVATRLMSQLVRRLRDAEEQLENAMLRDHPSRVVNTLMRLATERSPEATDAVVEVSPLELSSRVGLDVDAVKRAVQQLRDGGYLRIIDERIVLPDLGALRKLYELLGKKEEVRGGLS